MHTQFTKVITIVQNRHQLHKSAPNYEVLNNFAHSIHSFKSEHLPIMFITKNNIVMTHTIMYMYLFDIICMCLSVFVCRVCVGGGGRGQYAVVSTLCGWVFISRMLWCLRGFSFFKIHSNFGSICYHIIDYVTFWNKHFSKHLLIRLSSLAETLAIWLQCWAIPYFLLIKRMNSEFHLRI